MLLQFFHVFPRNPLKLFLLMCRYRSSSEDVDYLALLKYSMKLLEPSKVSWGL